MPKHRIINPFRTNSAFLISVCAWLLLLLAGLATPTKAQSAAPLLLRDPSISKTQIAFAYAGSIWIAERDGSNLRRLTTGGRESKPIFSPDGALIAFTGNYDGSRSVYVISANGGEPRRLTYHPSDFGAVGWSQDGKRILFVSGRTAFAGGVTQLFTVPLEGGYATPVPLIRASDGSYSPDGTRIAYVPNLQWQAAWKRYRGGQTKPIWIAGLADSGVQTTIPRDNSNDSSPMWVGDTIYFLSDRNGPTTLFAYDVNSKQVKQLVKNDGLDIKSASATSDAIVYEQFGSLHVLDLKSGGDRTLDLHPAADLAEVRPHFRKIELDKIQDAVISPTGARAAFAARGEVFTVPGEKGDIRDITNTTGVVERDPAWSPDGKSIAYLSDESGEYALHIRDQSGIGEVSKIDLGKPPTFYYSPKWSPDSKKIALTDKRLNVWYVDREKKVPIHIDSDTYTDPAHSLRVAWSPDSRWLTYTKQLKSHLHAVFVYSLEQNKTFQLTDGMSDALFPEFDREGKYLYFTASTDAALNTGWLDMTSLQRPVTRSVYVMVLKKDEASPLAPESDEEKGKAADKGDQDKQKEKDKDQGKEKDNDITTPQEAIFGPKVMITNEMAGSGGDALPWMFRRTKIGPLVGKRTWGGLVGHYTNPGDLLDGGFTGTPNLAFYSPDGIWDVENHGVPPDIEVELDPKAARTGHDAQLEKAVEVVMDLLKKNPPPAMPQHPPYPNYHKPAAN